MARGTYNEASLTISPSISPITISGAGQGVTVVDGNAAGSVFIVPSDVSATLSSLTIQHGSASTGGGIRVSGGSLTMTDATVSNNMAISNGPAAPAPAIPDLLFHPGVFVAVGGGIAVTRGSLIVTNSTVKDNTATSSTGGYSGGGIYDAGSLTLTNSTISGNKAMGSTANSSIPIGGGIHLAFGGTAILSNTTVSDNQANVGGGISADGSSGTHLQLSHSTVSHNTASRDGGGISVSSVAGTTVSLAEGTTVRDNTAPVGAGIHSGGTTTVSDSTITANTATNGTGSALGGGIHVFDGSLTLTNSTVSNNKANSTAAVHGGGIRESGGLLTLTNTTTVSGNTSTGLGGGISSGGMTTITNSTISGNSANSGGGGISNAGTLNAKYSTIAFNSSAVQNSGGTLNLACTIVTNSNGGADCRGIIVDLGYNLTGDKSCGFNQATSISGKDPQLAPLALTPPGTTQTHALKAGSPALDAGATTIGSDGCPATDQRGVSRPDELDTACDIGSEELVPLRVIILMPGITVSQNLSNEYNPYKRASTTFSALLDRLHCQQPQQAPSGSPLVTCNDPNLKWAPYSYEGVGPGGVSSYTDADTGQSIGYSVRSMDAVYSFLQANGAQGATFIAIGHSLGGAIASYWGAQHQDVKVITLDSPVSGIWPTPSNIYAPSTAYGSVVFPSLYCSTSLSIGFWSNSITCPFLQTLLDEVMQSAISNDLHTAAAIQGQANAINFANSEDGLVPSWFALNPNAPGGQVLINYACSFRPGNHGCILGQNDVLSKVVSIVNNNQTDNPWGTHDPNLPSHEGCAQTWCISLHIKVWDGANQVPVQTDRAQLEPGQAQVQMAHAGSDGSVQRLAADLRSDGNGGVSAIVPWADSIVQASISATQTACIAILPAAPTAAAYDVGLNVGGVSDTCNGLQIP